MSKIELAALEGIEGDVFTLNDGEYLCLHFDGRHIQSAMNLKEPFKLCFSYLQAMMAFKLFNANPASILIVGLGGGSLSKYCFWRFSDASIKTIEISNDVISLRDKFHIPKDDHRFRVVLADAAVYLPKIESEKDVILVDAYTASGLPDALCAASFYKDCYNALELEGILVVNLVQSDRRHYQIIRLVADIFEDNCLITYAEDCGNYILVARKSSTKLVDEGCVDLERRKILRSRGIRIPRLQSLAEFYS